MMLVVYDAETYMNNDLPIYNVIKKIVLRRKCTYLFNLRNPTGIQYMS